MLKRLIAHTNVTRLCPSAVAGMNIRHKKADVLVVGGGAAGLRAAIEAQKHSVKTLLVSKTPICFGSCTTYSGAFFSAVHGHSIEKQFKNTLESGKGLNNQELAEILVREARSRILELKNFGVRLYANPGGYICKGKPPVWGLEITKPLVRVAQSLGVKIYDRMIVLDLIKKESTIVGALGFDIRHGEFLALEATSVILATGGAGALYSRSDNPVHTTGDGYALAYHAGAALQDMEFVQFYPLGTAEPNLPVYILPALLADSGRILNKNSENIIQKYYIKDAPVAMHARDLLSRAIFLEILKGRGVNKSVLLDLTQVSREQLNMCALSMKDILLRRFKIRKRPIHISPLCHYFMGGIKVNHRCETDVNGLYAAGEVTGGIHGANRLGGNALSDAIVFGARAGQYAAEKARLMKKHQTDLEGFRERKKRLESLFHDKPRRGKKPKIIRMTIRREMWGKVGIVRSKETLEEVLEEFQKTREEILPNLCIERPRECMDVVEVMNGLDVAEMVARSALYRTESRGAHYRTDYPQQNDKSWLRNIIIRKNNPYILSPPPARSNKA